MAKKRMTQNGHNTSRVLCTFLIFLTGDSICIYTYGRALLSQLWRNRQKLWNSHSFIIANCLGYCAIFSYDTLLHSIKYNSWNYSGTSTLWLFRQGIRRHNINTILGSKIYFLAVFSLSKVYTYIQVLFLAVISYCSGWSVNRHLQQ